MIAMSGVRIVPSMHRACRTGSGMFMRLVSLLMRMLMGVSVIHVVLVFRGHEFEFLRGFHAAIIQV